MNSNSLIFLYYIPFFQISISIFFLIFIFNLVVVQKPLELTNAVLSRDEYNIITLELLLISQ